MLSRFPFELCGRRGWFIILFGFSNFSVVCVGGGRGHREEIGWDILIFYLKLFHFWVLGSLLGAWSNKIEAHARTKSAGRKKRRGSFAPAQSKKANQRRGFDESLWLDSEHGWNPKATTESSKKGRRDEIRKEAKGGLQAFPLCAHT